MQSIACMRPGTPSSHTELHKRTPDAQCTHISDKYRVCYNTGHSKKLRTTAALHVHATEKLEPHLQAPTATVDAWDLRESACRASACSAAVCIMLLMAVAISEVPKSPWKIAGGREGPRGVALGSSGSA